MLTTELIVSLFPELFRTSGVCFEVVGGFCCVRVARPGAVCIQASILPFDATNIYRDNLQETVQKA
jgi:hypothetical protein